MKLLHLLKETLDLSDKDSVIAWMNKNAPESLFDDDGNIDWNYTDAATGEDLETLIATYMEKYQQIDSEYEIEVYRMVKLDSIKQLDLKNVGTYWSFSKDGVGAYGIGKDFVGSKPYALTAIVKTQEIDWEQGFYSYLSYGRSEFECNMKKGSDCIIISINEKELESPIKAKC